MKRHYTYPVDLTPDEEGRVVARIPDLKGCVTDGATREEALLEAADALDTAIAMYLTEREPLPLPSPAGNRPVISAGAVIAAKAALHEALRAARLTNTALGERMGLPESEVRRMLDPKHKTKIGRLEEALQVCGLRLEISIEAA